MIRCIRGACGRLAAFAYTLSGRAVIGGRAFQPGLQFAAFDLAGLGFGQALEHIELVKKLSPTAAASKRPLQRCAT